MKKIETVPAISYVLSIFYAVSFLIYCFFLSVPTLRAHGMLLSLLYLVLFFSALGAADLKENARRNMINFSILLWLYSLLLLKIYPGLLLHPSYLLIHVIAVLFYSQSSVKLQFSPSLSGARKSILVVDDDEGLLRTIQKILLSNGYSVLTATSGEKGIQIANLQRPDLIILDVILPGIKGRDVCLRLKDDPITQNIPVVFLTNKDSPDDIKAEKAVGAATHLTKPVNAKILLFEVKKILKS